MVVMSNMCYTNKLHFDFSNISAICTQCIKVHKETMSREATWVRSAELVSEHLRTVTKFTKNEATHAGTSGR